ncbi:MAG: hypothetical protein Q7R34_12435 [Dehalococcoidia bacterium]|nr:hypothetical protein [Dehalococcoidia bacterium]
MDRKTDKRKESRSRQAAVRDDTPVEESLLIRQRLRNLCELAIAIGQKKGLLGNHGEVNKIDSEGGPDVADKGNIRDC